MEWIKENSLKNEQEEAFQPEMLAELDEVPDDEAVSRQIQLVDHRQLFFDLPLSARGQGSKACSRFVPCL